MNKINHAADIFHNFWLVNNCNRVFNSSNICTVIFAVSCESCTLGDVRFVGGTDASNGLLEMCNDNTTWTEVCGWSFDCDEAIVACRKAGYVEGLR